MNILLLPLWHSLYNDLHSDQDEVRRRLDKHRLTRMQREVSDLPSAGFALGAHLLLARLEQEVGLDPSGSLVLARAQLKGIYPEHRRTPRYYIARTEIQLNRLIPAMQMIPDIDDPFLESLAWILYAEASTGQDHQSAIQEAKTAARQVAHDDSQRLLAARIMALEPVPLKLVG